MQILELRLRDLMHLEFIPRQPRDFTSSGQGYDRLATLTGTKLDGDWLKLSSATLVSK
jgi:hypothetical protein